jgi:hypothetical protein
MVTFSLYQERGNMIVKQGSLGPTWAEIVAARNKREDEAVARRFKRDERSQWDNQWDNGYERGPR